MKSIYKFYLLVFILFSDYVLFAQPGDDDGGCLECDDNPPQTPINTKLIWLVIIGVVFVFYTIKRKKEAFNK